MADDNKQARFMLCREGPLAPWLQQLARAGRGSWGRLVQYSDTDVAKLPEEERAFLERVCRKRNKILRSDKVGTDDLQDTWDLLQGTGVQFCFDTIDRSLQVDIAPEHQVTVAAVIARVKDLVSPVDNHVQTAMMKRLHAPWIDGPLAEYVQRKEQARQRFLEAGGQLSLDMLKLYLADGVARRKAYKTKVEILRSQMSALSVMEVKRHLLRFEQEVKDSSHGEDSDDTSGEEKPPSEVALLTQKVDQLMRAQATQQRESARHTEVDDFQSGRG